MDSKDYTKQCWIGKRVLSQHDNYGGNLKLSWKVVDVEFNEDESQIRLILWRKKAGNVAGLWHTNHWKKP